MTPLILHLLGDYVTQSDWMASNKTKASFPAFAHALIYSLPFLLIGSFYAWIVIFSTHFLIDRFRLARFVVYWKNIVLGLHIKRLFARVPNADDPASYNPFLDEHLRDTAENLWTNCSATGYPSERPAWLAVWLLIACDNTLHLAINAAALNYL